MAAVFRWFRRFLPTTRGSFLVWSLAGVLGLLLAAVVSAEHLDLSTQRMSSTAWAECRRSENTERRNNSCRWLISRQAEAPHRRAFASYLLALDTESPDEKIRLLNEAINLDPRDHRYHDSKAYMLEMFGMLEDALASKTRALELLRSYSSPSSEMATILTTRARIREAMRQYPEALNDINEAILIDAGSPSAWAQRASILRRMFRLQEALSDVNRALGTGVYMADAFRVRSRIHLQMGQLENALADADEAFGRWPGARNHLSRAFVLLAGQQTQQAAEDIAAALHLEPDDSEALSHRCIISVREGSRDLADCDRAVSGAAPVDSDQFWIRASLRLQMGDTAGAMSDAEEAVRRDPTDPATWHIRSLVRDAVGDAIGSASDRERAERLFPHINEYHAAFFPGPREPGTPSP